jgi:hypothetical protein
VVPSEGLHPALDAAGADQMEGEDAVGQGRQVLVASVGAGGDGPGQRLPAGAAHRLQGQAQPVEVVVEAADAHARLHVEEGLPLPGLEGPLDRLERPGELPGVDQVVAGDGAVGERPAAAGGVHVPSRRLGLADDRHQARQRHRRARRVGDQGLGLGVVGPRHPELAAGVAGGRDGHGVGGRVAEVVGRGRRDSVLAGTGQADGGAEAGRGRRGLGDGVEDRLHRRLAVDPDRHLVDRMRFGPAGAGGRALHWDVGTDRELLVRPRPGDAHSRCHARSRFRRRRGSPRR